MSVSRAMLLDELKELQRLTAFEQAVATVRRAQAASAPVAEELAANAAKARERFGLLAQAVRGAGGTPDLVGPVLGKLGAFVQTQLNQVQTLQGALLGDLALEHQLRERARYARTLAVTLGESSVLPVLDRLDTAHTETIDWLERRLTEVGRTGSSALQATPVQAVVGNVRQFVGLPFALTTDAVNRVGALVGKLSRRAPAALSEVPSTVASAGGTVADKAGEVAGTVADKAGEVAGTAADKAGEVAGTAADTVADKAGQVADTAEATEPRDPQQEAADVTAEVLEATGGDDVADEKAPFAAYERLTGDSVMRHVADTEDVEELRTLLAFEQAHKARKGVLKAAQERLTELSANA